MDKNIEYSIYRIREYRKANKIAKSRLAVLAGVPEGILRNMDDKGWNPTLISLRKIDKVIPSNFIPKSASTTKQKSTSSQLPASP